MPLPFWAYCAIAGLSSVSVATIYFAPAMNSLLYAILTVTGLLAFITVVSTILAKMLLLFIH